MSRWNEAGSSGTPNWLMDASGHVLGFRDRAGRDYAIAAAQLAGSAELQAPPGVFAAAEAIAYLSMSDNAVEWAIARQLIDTISARVATALPARIVPYAPSGTTYYIDPTAATHGNGLTIGTPMKDLRDLSSPAPGTSILFKQGTIYQPGSGFIDVIPSAAPTSSTTAIVFGVYDAATGARISGRGAGLVTLDGQNQLPFVFRADHDLHSNCAYIELDGFKCINTTGTGNGRIKFQSVANCRVLNCDVSNSISKGIFFNGSTGSNYCEGNVGLECGEAAIYETMSAVAAGAYQYNNVCGITIVQATGTLYAHNGIIAGNTVQGMSNRQSDGINILCAGGSLATFGNHITQCKNGVAYQGANATPDTFTGLIEDNEITFCRLGISKVNTNGLIDQFNRIDRVGTFDGLTGYDQALNFGRGVEMYGLTSSVGPTNCITRYNLITRPFSDNPDASEGIGIGFDNNATNCIAYGNVIIDSYSNGIQSNRSTNCKAVGNVIINPMCAPAGQFPNIIPSTGGRKEAGVNHVVSPGWEASNNTIICGTGPYSRHGLSEAFYGSSGGSPGARIFNNLVISAPVSAVLVDTSAGKTAEYNNLFEDCTGVRDGTGAPVATTSTTVALGATGVSKTSFRPRRGGPAHRFGGVLGQPYIGLGGKSLASRTPAGAFHAA